MHKNPNADEIKHLLEESRNIAVVGLSDSPYRTSHAIRVIVGAWAVAPLAGEWIHQACLAVRTRMSVDTLLDSIFQFPTFSQAYLEALEKMDL